MTAQGSILTLNAGSSSIKFALFQLGSSLSLQLRGEIEDLDTAPFLHLETPDGTRIAEQRWSDPYLAPFTVLLDALLAQADAHLGTSTLVAVGHRIVHGGSAHIEPAPVTEDLLSALNLLIPLDPLHLPHNLAPVRTIAAARPNLAQIVCFDTAFHHTMPLEAAQIALPRAITDTGVRRFGFHGLSYEFIAGELQTASPKLAAGRVIVAHLGSGASLCALLEGRSIATTMGFSTLDGLVMSTRCGTLDPGVIFYLARQGHSLADIEDMLYRHSGLLGVSDLSGDIRLLLASGDAKAREAVDVFTYHIARDICGMVGVLGGIDGLVFTAGIGQHSAAIRAGVCARLTWLGVRLDPALNQAHAASINAEHSLVDVRVMATDEELMIARHTQALINELAPL